MLRTTHAERARNFYVSETCRPLSDQMCRPYCFAYTVPLHGVIATSTYFHFLAKLDCVEQ